MTEHCNRLGFIAESAQEFFILCKLLFQDFDGNGLIIDHIRCAVYIRHAALADPLRDLVAPVELLSDVLVIAIFFHHKPPCRLHSGKTVS